MSNLIAIGVGGTGAKLVEALIHLSASGHSPDTIYPILIDQDLHNGNVQRTKKVIQQYKILNELINSFGSQGIFNSELRTESNMPDYQIIVHEDLVKKLLAYRLLHSKNDNEKRTVQRMKLIYSQMGQPLTEPEAQKYGKLLFDSFDPSVQLQLVETTIATIAHCYTAVTRSQSFNNPEQVFVEVDKKRGKNYTSSISPQELDLDHYIAHAVKSGDEVGVNNMENYAFELLSQQIHLALKWYEQNPLY